ncbi:MAG: NAD(P)H-dependent glycerol-3-phosphate dehydrogenase [Candidatus Heteroscillospira sp.]|jgi:glycerol-3-phosphate dehydrogenase (NAD(P)+)
MKITVIGCGRWGSFIAWYLDHIGHQVSLYGREGSANMQRFMSERRNDYLELTDTMTLTTDISSVMDSETVVISIGSQNLESLVEQLAAMGVKNKNFVLCMKGIEIGTGRRLSQIATQGLDASNRVAVWIGPGHVQEFYKGVPNCMVIDSLDEELKSYLVEQFSSELIRFYYGADLIGNEVGAAAKNVIGIAAGILDGLGLSTLKGALMSRGTREIARLIKAMGGNELSAYGLCHLGDYEATVFSQFSHNRRYGEMLVNGEKYGKLAEGCFTVKALLYLSEKHGVELPICSAVNDVLYNGAEPRQAIASLFTRSLKQEF